MSYIVGFVLNVLAGIVTFYFIEWTKENPERIFITICFLILSTLLTLSAIYIYKNRDFLIRFREFVIHGIDKDGHLIIPKFEDDENLLKSYNNYGVARIVDSMVIGEGSTKSILNSVNHSFCFKGIAFTKWLMEKNELDDAVARITQIRNQFRILLLNPESIYAIEVARWKGAPQDSVKKNILQSLSMLKGILQSHAPSKIEVRLYDFLPIFRIAIVDQKTAYVGYYRSNKTREKDSPQLVLDSDVESKITFFKPFYLYFETVWDNSSIAVDWDKIPNITE